MRPGEAWESMACQFLIDHGLELVVRNFRIPYGEIDLIMRDGNTLVFVEVKYRSSERYGNPLEVVTRQKQQKIKLVASVYLEKLTVVPCVRFDVVGIVPDRSEYRITWVKGAFE
ncbi:MAG: YraN family protein [Firmicutes bacterium]|nr:YraN family protein [Bacillota bacterium]